MTSAREKSTTETSGIKVRSLNDMAKTFVATRQGTKKAVTSLNQFTEQYDDDKEPYVGSALNFEDNENNDYNNDSENDVDIAEYDDYIENENEVSMGNSKYRRCGSLNINERAQASETINSRKKQYFRQTSLEDTLTQKRIEPVCGIEDNQLRELYRLKCQDLQIGVFNDPENRFVQGIKKKSTRTKLCLYESSFGPKALEKLGQIVQNNAQIAQLCLRKSTLGTAAIRSFAKSLAMMPNLVHLELANNAIEPQDFVVLFEELSVLKTLISIDFSNYEPDKKNKFTAECLGAFKKFANGNIYLQFVKLSNLMLEDEVVQGITEALEGCPNLLSVNLSTNNCTGKCVEKLLPLLTKTTIIRLDLSYNKLKKEGATHLAKTIQDFRGINRPGLELILENTHLGEDINLIFTALGRNTNISKLNLSQNMMSNVEIIRLETALSETVKLMELNLSHCKIGDSGGRILALGLQKNFWLQSLVLASNDLTDEIGAQIIYSLIPNTNFKSLDMSQNKLSSESAKALQELIKKNPNVEKYNFSMNKINEKDGYLLQEILHFNSKITQLNLHHNPVKYNTIETVERIVKDNLRKRINRAIPKLKNEVAKRRVLVNDEKQGMGNVEDMERIKEDVARDVERFQNTLATLKEKPESPTIRKNEKIILKQGKEIKVNNQEYNDLVIKKKEFTQEAYLETEGYRHLLEGVRVSLNQCTKKVEAKKREIEQVREKYDPEVKRLKLEISKLRQDNQFYEMYNDTVFQKIKKEKKKNTVANRLPAPKISDMFLATSELARHIRKNNESQVERTMQESRSRLGMMESQSQFSQISDDSRVLKEYNFALKSQRLRISTIMRGSDKKDLKLKNNNRKLTKSEDPMREAMKERIKEKIQDLLKDIEPKGPILDQIVDA